MGLLNLGTLKVLPTETMPPGFPPKLRNRSRMFRKQLAERRMELSPANPPGRPARGARGAPENPTAVKIRSCKKRGPSRFFLRLGWPYGPAGVGTAANGSRSVGHGPISRLPLQDFGLSAHNKQPSLPRSQKGNNGDALGGVLGSKYRGLRTPIHRVADHPRGKLGRGRTT